MKLKAGFTWIELLASLVMIALLGVLAVPRFAVEPARQPQTPRADAKTAVMSAHSTAIATLKDFPSVIQLATYLDNAEQVTATGHGLRFPLDNASYTVLTYIDASCSRPTGKVTDPVLCVGTASNSPR